MFKLVTRVGIATFAGLVCCCVVEPEAPLSLLKGFIDSQEPTAENVDNPSPKIDLAVVKATLAMHNRQSLESPAGMAAPTKKQLDDMFFSDAESVTKFFSDAESATKGIATKGNPTKESALAKIKIPFLSGDSEQPFEPIDVGATIQSNPFLGK